MHHNKSTVIKLPLCVVALSGVYEQVCWEAWSEQEVLESVLRCDFIRRGSEKS